MGDANTLEKRIADALALLVWFRSGQLGELEDWQFDIVHRVVAVLRTGTDPGREPVPGWCRRSFAEREPGDE